MTRPDWLWYAGYALVCLGAAVTIWAAQALFASLTNL